MLFVRFVFKKINILNSSLKFYLSLQGLKGDICHSHSSTLAEHSHATYHYLSNLGDKQFLPSKQPSSPGVSPRLRYMLSYFHHLIMIEVQAYHSIIALWMLRLLLDAQAIALLIKLCHTISLRITYTIAKYSSFVIDNISSVYQR